jgi:hypothetical protein
MANDPKPPEPIRRLIAETSEERVAKAIAKFYEQGAKKRGRWPTKAQRRRRSS